MAFGIRARRFTVLALGPAHGDGSGPSIAESIPEDALDPWLDTLAALARNRVEQRATWDAEARLRVAIRARSEE